jgi:hypothetical protein
MMIAHGLVHGHPAENSTAIVRGKWPLNEPVMQRMVYSELLSSFIVPEASGHPTVTFPIIPFDQIHKISPLK